MMVMTSGHQICITFSRYRRLKTFNSWMKLQRRGHDLALILWKWIESHSCKSFQGTSCSGPSFRLNLSCDHVMSVWLLKSRSQLRRCQTHLQRRDWIISDSSIHCLLPCFFLKYKGEREESQEDRLYLRHWTVLADKGGKYGEKDYPLSPFWDTGQESGNNTAKNTEKSFYGHRRRLQKRFMTRPPVFPFPWPLYSKTCEPFV